MYEMLKAKNEWSQERATDFARRLIQHAQPKPFRERGCRLGGPEMRRHRI